MKRLLRTFGLAGAAVVAGGSSAFAASAASGMSAALCKLAEELGGVFSTLSVLAFVGAAFIIAGWAWGFISSGKVEMKDVKEKGVGMLVGFILLFGMGSFLQIFLELSKDGGALGCDIAKYFS